MSDIIYDLPNRPITIIISDLHIGGGETDKNDDHVNYGQSFIRFLNELPDLVKAQSSEILLVINGDFLDFAQTAPDLFDPLISYGNWCSEKESVDKLDVIIKGNLLIWEAMKNFQKNGGYIVINLGNHDIDFTWAKVRSRLTEIAGHNPIMTNENTEQEITASQSLEFVLGKDWLSAYDGKLFITHGNQFDPANKFNDWHNPIVGYTPERLEMCAGTMFMVKFINPAEEKYPFIDNIIPVTRLYSVLRDNDPDGFAELRWLLGIFIAKNPIYSLGVPSDNDFKKERLFQRYQVDNEYKKSIDLIVAKYLKDASLFDTWNQNADSFNDIIFQLLSVLPNDKINKVLKIKPGTLGIVRAGLSSDVEILQNAAKTAKAKYNAQFVVMGHTHVPDQFDGYYFNSGSWTRYWNIKSKKEITLTDLQNEANFPYELNFVEIRKDASGKLSGKKVLFEKQP